MIHHAPPLPPPPPDIHIPGLPWYMLVLSAIFLTYLLIFVGTVTLVIDKKVLSLKNRPPK